MDNNDRQLSGPSSTRAVVLTQYGSDEFLEYRKEFAIPKLTSRSVLVKLQACGITETDKKLVEGSLKCAAGFPIVIGTDIAGTVEAVGTDVQNVKTGDEVVAILPADCNGGLAEYFCVDSLLLVKRPAAVTPTEAAAVLTAGLRAISALHYKMKITNGDSLLVLNAASPTGIVATQLALHWGARVIATANNPNEFNFVQGLSPKIDKVIDLSTESLYTSIKEETGGLGVDYILQPEEVTTQAKSMPDVVLRNLKRDCIKSLAVHGTWVTSSAIQLDPPDTGLLAAKDATVAFSYDQSWLLAPTQQGRYLHMLGEVLELAAKGVLKCPTAYTLPLEKARQSISLLDACLGRIVVVNQM